MKILSWLAVLPLRGEASKCKQSAAAGGHKRRRREEAKAVVRLTGNNSNTAPNLAAEARRERAQRSRAPTNNPTRMVRQRRNNNNDHGDGGVHSDDDRDGRTRSAAAAAAAARSTRSRSSGSGRRREARLLRRATPMALGLPLLLSLLGLLMLTLLLLPIRPAEASYAVTIEAGDEECLFVRTPDEPSVISGNYDILDDAASGSVLRARIDLAEEPHTNLWKSRDGMSEDTFTVNVAKPRQHVEFCMEIVKDVDDDEVEEEGLRVGFNLYVRSAVERSLPDGEGGPDAERALKLVQDTEVIVSQWRNLMDHFDFLRNREAQHNVLTSQILSRVMGWTILEAVLVVTMAVAQVMYWKRFFEQRRYL